MRAASVFPLALNLKSCNFGGRVTSSSKDIWQQVRRGILCTILSLVFIPGFGANDSSEKLAVNKIGNSPCATQSTLLSPNSISLTSSVQSINNDHWVILQTGGVTYWTALLSNSNVDVILPNDRGNAVVTFRQGLIARLSANGSGGLQIFLSGKITDDLTEYNIVGKLIGSFQC
jgi:hypothetical protein